MREIEMTVTDRVPVFTNPDDFLIADNTDYTLRIAFDEEWDAGAKTVWLYLDGVGLIASTYTENDVALLPRITLPDNSYHALAVGIQQGGVKTSRNACILVYPSAETQVAFAISGDITQPWFTWVNDNILDVVAGNRRADQIADEAEGYVQEARAAAEAAEREAQSAAVDAAAARISAQTIQFPIFWINEAGYMVISYAERLGTTSFRLDNNGYLHVEV